MLVAMLVATVVFFVTCLRQPSFSLQIRNSEMVAMSVRTQTSSETHSSDSQFKKENTPANRITLIRTNERTKDYVYR